MEGEAGRSLASARVEEGVGKEGDIHYASFFAFFLPVDSQTR